MSTRPRLAKSAAAVVAVSAEAVTVAVVALAIKCLLDNPATLSFKTKPPGKNKPGGFCFVIYRYT
jgi:hypothetical protein